MTKKHTAYTGNSKSTKYRKIGPSGFFTKAACSTLPITTFFSKIRIPNVIVDQDTENKDNNHSHNDHNNNHDCNNDYDHNENSNYTHNEDYDYNHDYACNE